MRPLTAMTNAGARVRACGAIVAVALILASTLGAVSMSNDGSSLIPNDAKFGKSISVGESLTAPAISNSGTITTAAIGSARVNPAGAVTGIILQAGTRAGQQATVINESASTVTFATAATSNVADGVSAVIGATKKMDFTWDSSTARWYHN